METLEFCTVSQALKGSVKASDMKSFIMVLAVSSFAHSFADDSGDKTENNLFFKPQKSFESALRSSNNRSSVIASLRETPSELHLCSAFFIRADALLTTAKCIYGRRTEHTYIHCLSRFQMGSGVSIPVKKFVPHPYYEITPQINDLGMIFITKFLFNAFVHSLPLPWQNHRGIVTMYQWKFLKDNTIFALHEKDVRIITNGKCSLILNEYVQCKYICVGGELIHQGSMDKGLPLSGKHGNRTYALAIYNREGTDRTVMAEKYEKIYPHVEWIKHVLKHMPLSSAGVHPKVP